jgi:hypothetical protein
VVTIFDFSTKLRVLSETIKSTHVAPERNPDTKTPNDPAPLFEDEREIESDTETPYYNSENSEEVPTESTNLFVRFHFAPAKVRAKQ